MTNLLLWHGRDFCHRRDGYDFPALFHERGQCEFQHRFHLHRYANVSRLTVLRAGIGTPRQCLISKFHSCSDYSEYSKTWKQQEIGMVISHKWNWNKHLSKIRRVRYGVPGVSPWWHWIACRLEVLSNLTCHQMSTRQVIFPQTAHSNKPASRCISTKRGSSRIKSYSGLIFMLNTLREPARSSSAIRSAEIAASRSPAAA